MTIWNVIAGKNNNLYNLDYLIAGGGGAASATLANYNASGGGGGGFYQQSNVVFNTGIPYYIKVGAGGVWANNTLKKGNNGDYSQFHTDVVGGGQGAFQYGQGSGGAAGAYGNTSPGTGNAANYFLDAVDWIIANPSSGLVSSWARQANTGLAGSSPAGRINYYVSAQAGDGTYAVSGWSYGGVYSSITGANTEYCKGGKDMYYGNAENGVRGGGGNAADWWYRGNIGGSGGNGMVIIRHSLSLPVAYTTGNPTITTTGNFRVYTWSTPGTYTVVFQ
jgi:hypothetical protein